MAERFTGPAYSFGPDPSGTLGPKGDVGVIFTSIVNILTTPIGTLPYAPRMGSWVPDLVFEILDDVTIGLIRHYAREDIERQEPRVVVQDILVYTLEEQDPHKVNITISFSVVGDPEGRIVNAPVSFSAASAT